MSLGSVLSLFITGAVWGISTPLLKRYSKDIEEVHHSNPIFEYLLQLKAMFSNPKYLMSFVVNQSGSVLYAISLSYNPITIAVPVTNALNFVFVLIIGSFLGEKALDIRTMIGSMLVITGIVLCILNQEFNKIT